MVTRYSPVIIANGDEAKVEMEEHPIGDWVSASEYEELEAERDQLEARVHDLTAEIEELEEQLNNG